MRSISKHCGISFAAVAIAAAVSAPASAQTQQFSSPAQAAAKQAIVDRKLTNVVIGTGNSCHHSVAHVPVNEVEPEDPALAVEFMSSSISFSGDSNTGWTGKEAVRPYNPHMELMVQQRGYQIYDLTPKLSMMDVKVMEHVGMPAGRISTLPSDVVTPDQPLLIKLRDFYHRPLSSCRTAGSGSIC